MRFLFPYFVLFAFVIRFLAKRNNNSNRKKVESFFEREAQANSVRKKDIEHLNYITIPVDSLPFSENTSPEINTVQQRIMRLSDHKILNLTGLTNTDLKMQYGVGNLAFLSDCDLRFSELTGLLVKWAELLIQENRTEDAVTVLEFGAACGSDASRNYHLLADYYAQQQDTQKLLQLKESASKLKTLMKDSIVCYIDSKLPHDTQ